MRPIDRFILYVVHNWTNNLNEAYSPDAMKGFITKFRDEADDFNIDITDKELKRYIERFDILKNSPKVQEKDLNKVSLSQLIRIVTASKGAEIEDEEEEERTPDVVYQDNGITIWNGNSDENCITYGRGERWCITRGSWAGHRYDSTKGYPTFYLAKNSNLPDSNKLSFIVIQVKSPSGSVGLNRYVLHPRDNDPYYPPPISFNTLLNQASWLRDIPNLQNILRYIPLTNKEKSAQLSRISISIREWMKLPFETKKQYLVARGQNNSTNMFSDVDISTFLSKYLPKYPQIATFIAITPNIINSIYLLRTIESFSNQDQKSIIENTHNFSINELTQSEIPFVAKKIFVYKNKVNIPNYIRLYVTEDKSTIVQLSFDNKDEIKVALYQEEDTYPNVKLSKRTAKYLLEYPDLDKIPLSLLLKLSAQEIISSRTVLEVLNKAESDPNSALIVKQTEDGKIIFDSNRLSAYKLENNKISSLSTNSDEIQEIINDSINSENFQENIIDLCTSPNNSLPSGIDISTLKRIINATPLEKRIKDRYIILTSDSTEFPIFGGQQSIRNVNSLDAVLPVYGFTPTGEQRTPYRNGLEPDTAIFRSYFRWLRESGQSYDISQLLRIFANPTRTVFNVPSRKAFLEANPPLSDTNYAVYAAPGNDIYYIINIDNPAVSYKLSSQSGKLIRANIPASFARRVANRGEVTPTTGGETPTPSPANQVAPRRGRPAGVPNAPRAPQPPAAPAGEVQQLRDVAMQFNLVRGLNVLGPSSIRRFSMGGVPVPLVRDRGVSRRNNILGQAGRVTAAFDFGPSSIYIIQLANNTTIASVVIQPGNSHYLVTSDNAFQLDSPSDLLRALQQRNLAEAHQYIVNEYMSRNPHHLNEFKQLLRKHINEKKKK